MVRFGLIGDGWNGDVADERRGIGELRNQVRRLLAGHAADKLRHLLLLPPLPDQVRRKRPPRTHSLCACASEM
eukprot:2035262-Rhodomonas_salina.1